MEVSGAILSSQVARSRQVYMWGSAWWMMHVSDVVTRANSL
jgi:hypothetical protein